jgi:hypothetical protein
MLTMFWAQSESEGSLFAVRFQLADLLAGDEVAPIFRVVGRRQALAPVEDLALRRGGEADRPG